MIQRAELTVGGRARAASHGLQTMCGAVAGVDVLLERGDRMQYATDASLYQVEPLGVVLPHTPEAGAEAVRWLTSRAFPVLPRGAGTALAGQSVNRAVVVDFSKYCRAIESIDAVRRRAIVQPGVVLDQLNAALASVDLVFGPDVATSSHATIGGMIGNNSAGAHSIVYGRTVESLIAVEVVLHDGRVAWLREGGATSDGVQRAIAEALWTIVEPMQAEIDARFPKILRHVDGYNLDLFLAQVRASAPGTFDRVNLAHIVCGAEGTLCTVLRAELALAPRPKARGLAILGFATIDEALASLAALLATQPSAIELVDDVIIRMARRNRECAPYVHVMPQPVHGALGAVLYVQYFGQSHSEVRERCDAVAGIAPHAAHRTCVDAASMEQAWKLRKAGEPLLHGVPGTRKPVTFVEDTAVDPKRLPAFVKEFRAIVERHGTTAAYYAHASVGCLHIRPLIALEDPADLARMQSIAVEVAGLVAQYHGALSGEHGDGRVRTPLLRLVLGDALCDALARVKAVFDPRGLMNPGNLVDNRDPSRIVQHLRVRPLNDMVAVPSVPTFFRFAPEEGFAHAVTQCNGAGLCRRLTPGGTMCPSYRALRDERHTTRGRANELRLAITGQLGSPGTVPWNDAHLKETLALCLSCKACKAECPSNVDLAKLKAEYTAQGFAAAGRVPWRVMVRGRVRQMQRWCSRVPWLANALVAFPPARRAIAYALGLAPWRPMLRYHRSLACSSPPSLPRGARPTVILFGDCFSQYSEGTLGRDAVEVLERFGYRVIVGDVGCCARSMISTGMLADALHEVPRTARALRARAEHEGADAILMLEPSCASAIVDDWQDLSLDQQGTDDAAWVAQRTALVERFLDDRWDAHPTRPIAAPGVTERVAVHAHCHAKALWGAAGSDRLLARYFPSTEVLATGCCGMAGSFGMDRDTAELSVEIARQDLVPAIEARPSHLVCASGTSCRHQIADVAHREALHPISLVRRALG